MQEIQDTIDASEKNLDDELNDALSVEDDLDDDLDDALGVDDDLDDVLGDEVETSANPAPKITVPDEKKAHELFDQVDGNASGKLSLAELDKAIIVLYPELNHKAAIMRAYKSADSSGDGFVSRREFSSFLHYIVYYNNLWGLFAVVDHDGDHRLSREEFLKVAPQLELDGDANAVFDQIDSDSGGMILFVELCQYMAKSHLDAATLQQNIEDDNKVQLTTRSAKEVPREEQAPMPEAATKIAVPGKEKALEIFDQIDGNASGKLSLAELDKAIIMMYPDLNHKAAIMRAYKSADSSGDGFVSRREFFSFLHYIVYYNNLWGLFEVFDHDGDHRISREEFLQVAPQLNLGEDANGAFDKMDSDGGGKILFVELCQYMARYKSDWGSEEDDVAAVKQQVEEASIPVATMKHSPQKKSEHEPVPEAVAKIQVPPKEIALDLFDSIDDNASGKLSLAELDKVIVMLYPALNHKPAIMRAYKSSDSSGDGFVSKLEFPMFLQYIVYYNNLWGLFEMIDQDGDHRVSLDEFLEVAPQLELSDDADKVFDMIDSDGGGMILFAELCLYMASSDHGLNTDVVTGRKGGFVAR